jgi:putative NADPH-quinone reductase
MVTAGGSLEEYERKKLNYQVEDNWKPFEYLAKYCQMIFEQPIYLHAPYIKATAENSQREEEVVQRIQQHANQLIQLIK